jgi:dihydroorotase
MTGTLVVRGGLAFINGSFSKKDILIADGVIATIGGSLTADETINAAGCIVLPGLIDPHVHLREPGDTYKEDFKSGGRAAIAGGFTTVMDMPNNRLPTITKARLVEKQHLAKEKALCDVLFHFGGTDSNFDEVRNANSQSLKLYLGKTTGELMLHDPASLKKHFTNFQKDRSIVLHACDDNPDEAKNITKTWANVENCVSLASKINRRIHIAHASTGHELMLAKKWKRCTTEVSPHHLFLSKKDAERLGPYGKVYPQLRSETERIGLWKLLDGVDCIATDHAPHTPEDKEAGAAGFPGLETSLALMLDACAKGLLDRVWVAERMSSRVADTFSITDKGRIRKGFAGDLTIADPRTEWTVDAGDFESKCKWSPFDNKMLKGRVRTVIRAGKPVYVDNEFWG